MELSQLHFARPLWLWGALAIPLMWMIFFLFYRIQHPLYQLEEFIDRHLLPYLLVNKPKHISSLWKTLLVWSIVWSCLILAIAGPRWTFREMETFSQDQSLVILLDLSESMNATDLKPSRLIRAKQKIEDLLNLSKGVKIGLIVFAADSHMITPITEDKETIRHLLPSLETDLIYVQGSRLSPALDMAANLLKAEPGHNKALLVISDGGFEDASAIMTAKKLAKEGVIIHVMGVGTLEGFNLQEKNSAKKNRTPVFSKLEKDRLNAISKVGNGRYLEVHYSDHEETILLTELEKRADTQVNIGKKKQFWDEGFYLVIIPILPILLWWFKRGYVIAIIFMICHPVFVIEAADLQNYFKNSEELGQQILDKGDYESASQIFQDPYRKGVAYYRANHFAEAEKMFRQSSRPDVASATAYNLGNALAQQQKFKEAMTVYEEVLEKWPDHIKAKENLEIVKKILEQQHQNSSQSENSNQQEDQNKQESKNEEKKKHPDSKNSNKQEQKQDDKQQDHEKKPDDKQQRNNEEQSNDKQTQDSQKQSDDKQQEEQKQKSNQVNSDQKQKEKHDEFDKQHDNQEERIEQQQMKGEEKFQKDHQEKNDIPHDQPEEKALKSQEDQDADLWLNQITNDSKKFLKNKFYIESKKNRTKEGIDPW